jgi:hypothetical protein
MPGNRGRGQAQQVLQIAEAEFLTRHGEESPEPVPVRKGLDGIQGLFQGKSRPLHFISNKFEMKDTAPKSGCQYASPFTRSTEKDS